MEKNESKRFLKIIGYVVAALGYAGLLAGTIGFAVINQDLIINMPVLLVIAALTFAIAPALFFILRKKEFGKVGAVLSLTLAGIAIVADAVAGILLITKAFSPLIHSGAFVVILPVSGGLTVVGIALSLFVPKHKAFTTATATFLICLMILGAGWICFQPFGEYSHVTSVKTLFKSGEEGYASYRIPSLICLNKDVLNSKLDVDVEGDVLIASAEGRRNSSADEGEIDLVLKISFDSGKTWGNLQTLLSYDDVKGKYGNPTPIFDENTGLLHMIYTTSTEKSKFLEYDMFDIVATLKKDKTFEWSHPKQIAFEGDHIALMSGPNKGIMLSDGRLAFACYANYKGAPSEGFVVFSDDHGETWTRSETIAEGNECDLLELNDGSLLYVLRDNTLCTSIHKDTKQMFFRSADGGTTWERWATETPLKTPICQCCLNKTEDKIYLTYPDNSYTRSDLSIAYSVDAKHFSVEKIYDGPSGYSSSVTLSNGKICVFAETGRINYMEQLTFFELEAK